MNSFLIATLLNVLKIITSGPFMNRLVEMVAAEEHSLYDGEGKRQAVLAQLKLLGTELKPVFVATATYIINLALETAVAYVRSKQK